MDWGHQIPRVTETGSKMFPVNLGKMTIPASAFDSHGVCPGPL